MDPCEDTENHLRANRSREKTYMFDVAFDQQAQQVPSSQLLLSNVTANEIIWIYLKAGHISVPKSKLSYTGGGS